MKIPLGDKSRFSHGLLMEIKLHLRVALALCVAVSFCSCASVTVTDAGKPTKGGTPTAAPKRIYVVPFSTANALVNQHPMRKNPGQLPQEAQDLIAQSLVAELSQSIAPASLVKSPAAAGRDGWVITGDITRIDEGSRILRMAVGLGAGSTKMETAVAVRTAGGDKPPFLSFSTKGTSGATPGGATNPIPFSGAATVLFQGQRGVTDDARRTARMITSRIADYMVRRGWPVKGKVSKTKMATN